MVINSIFKFGKSEPVESRYETLDNKMVLSSKEPFFKHFIKILNNYEKINFKIKDNKLVSESPKTENSLFVNPVYEENDKVILSLNQMINPAKPRCTYNLHDGSSRIEWYNGQSFKDQNVTNCMGINQGYEKLFMDLEPELGDIKNNSYKHVERLIEAYFNCMKE